MGVSQKEGCLWRGLQNKGSSMLRRNASNSRDDFASFAMGWVGSGLGWFGG